MAIPEYVDLKFVNNLAKELLNSVGKYNKQGIQYDDTRLYARKELFFRTIIDSIFPSMLVIDYNNIRAELKKYSDPIKSLKNLLGDDYVNDIDDETRLSFSFNKLSEKEVDLLISAIKTAESQLKSKAVATTTAALQEQLAKITSSYDTNTTVLRNIKILFSKVYRLTDSSKPIYIFPSFDILTGQLGVALKNGLSIATELAQSNFRFSSVGELLDFGHTAVGYSEGSNVKLSFNSPKLFGILYDVVSSANNVQDIDLKAREISKTFIEETKQVEEFVEIEKDFSNGFMKLFISIGGNVVRFENALLNQRRGSILESRQTLGTNKVILQRLAQQFKNLGSSGLASDIYKKLTIGRSSPSVLDYIKYNIISAIEGKKVQNYKGKSTSKSSTTSKTKMPVLSGIAKTKKLPKKAIPSTNLKSNLVRLRPNLVNLQNLINASLVEQVKRNMGRGERRDVLNLRTGRFAESVKVERMTQSREGMITAFYSYMKNPYATFSQGGLQQSPKSRDPKLLIARSIREIAAQQVANRLRSVSV